MARTIHTRDERREQFIKAGLKIARKSGVKGVSGAAVARECSVTAPLIFHNFGSIKGFREAVAEAAKKQGVTLAEAATPAPRKRSVAEVKAIKDKVAGKREVKPKMGRKKTAAEANLKKGVKKSVLEAKAVAAAKKPRTVTKTAKPAKAVVAAKKPRATRKPAAPRVSSAFSPMPAPAAPATTGDQQ